ncbi:cytochrome c oxidase subunit 3 [Haliscomenobacter sp.]|uniref:cytochrome c oxidase subunit 3 n=1 Tax=Haliscomenobacter sp. TaxID=2717303 RepID=UPI003364DC01
MANTDTALEHHVHELDHQGDDAWSGAQSPFKVSYGKIMMWYFLLSDAFTFAGFLITYGALRFSSPTWPVPDFVFSTDPFGISDYFGKAPLIFVTFMSFLLIISSVTMVRGVQEGHRENKNGVLIWMVLTIFGGLGFLGCQAWEWTNLIGKENMSLTRNTFGTHTAEGYYLDHEGKKSAETFREGESYLIHRHAPGGHSAEHGAQHEYKQGDQAGYLLDEKSFVHRKFVYTAGAKKGVTQTEQFGPAAFGALFFFITGFHGFHVFSGVVFLTIIALNVASGVYVTRKNGYEMVEKIGLYWHFVDLVWVFVFLVFYLL